MKKTIKTYSRRTLSIVMSLLMIMTAWVFVAPQKAEAIDTVTSTSSFSASCSWASGSPSKDSQITINSISASISSVNATTVNVNVSVSATASKSGASVFGTTRSWSGTLNVYVNGVSIGTVSASGSAKMYSLGDSTKDCSWSGSKSATRSISSVALSGTSSVDIPATGSTTATYTAYGKDQFGVRFTGNVTFSNNGSFSGSTSRGSSYDTYTMTLTSAGRTAQASKNYTITATVGGKSATYTLTTYSKYRFTYDKNGGATLGSPTYYDARYGSTVGSNFPTTGTRIGYEFLGMSTAGTSNYDATKPTTFTGKLTSSQTITADTTYKATWWAKNVTVTYLNNDGSVLKTATNAGKYDKKAGDITAAAAPANPTYVRAPGVEGTFDYVFDHWEVASAKQYDNANNNNQSDYSDIVGQNYNTAVLKGDTVFVAVYRINSMNTYTINYKNGTQSGTVSTYHYKDEGKTGSYATATYPASDAESKTWTYEFLGWAEQVNVGDTVYYQDWDADLGAYVPQNNAQTPLTDTKVYHDATWVAVYGRKYIDYKVTFNFVGVSTDPDTGATVYNAGNQEVITKHYDETIQIPEALSYTGGKLSGTAPAGVSYSNSTGNTYNFSAWTPALSGTEIAVAALSANGWTASNANLKTRTFTATYSSVAAVYTIKFVGPDTVAGADGKQYAQYDAETGELLTQVLNPTTSFSHGSSVSSAKNAAEAAVVRTWRDDDNEYSFTGWAPTYASTATDNVTYTAQYAVAPLYTVTYADENGELGTWKGTTTENIPLDGVAAPTKEDDLYATDYTFSGWATTEYDAKNPVTPQITATRNMLVPEGGTTVYAQFTRTPIIYEINFIYGDPVDGVMPDHKQNLEYGEDVVIPTGDTLNRSDDETYHYTFANWDSVPGATVTGNATYTANYRKSYVYYDVTWLYQNGEQVEGEDHIFRDFRVEKYICGERIRAPFSTPAIRITDPAQDPLLPTLEANHEYAFDQWVLAKKEGGQWVPQRDADNNLIPFNNNTYIEAGVEYGYLPTYKSVAALRTLTILDEDGTTVLGTMDIGVGETILNYVSSPEAKNPDDTYHYVFDKWTNTADGTALTAATTMPASNMTIKANYLQQAHTYEFFETKTAPTFDAAGVATLVCEEDGCGHTADVNLPALSDSELPTVRLYVKNTHWDSTVPPALTELDNTVIPIAPNSLLIANSTDSAEVSAYYINKATKEVKTALASGDDANDYIAVEYSKAGGSGVTKIWAYYSTVGAAYTLEGLADVPESTESNPDGWHLLYDKAVTPGEANHSDVFASFEPAIEDGEQYIVYLKAIDAKGNVNYVSSKKLGYDTTAPTVTLTTEAGGNEARTKFCLDATIVLDEADLTVLLDGEPITMTAVTSDEDDTVTYEYALTTVGKHTVRVTDPAGNVTLKAFEIIGEHRTTETYKAATCTEDGWKKDVCDLCGNAIGEVTTYPATGHDYQTKTKRATCTEAGYTQEVCSKCGDTKDPVAIPALGHDWNDGTITKQPNCTQNGIIVFKCTRCGVNDIVEGDALDVTADGYDADAAAAILAKHEGVDARILHDGESHSFKADKQTTAPTCTAQGEITKECRYCHERFHVSDVPALGHDWTADEADEAAWTVGQAPTCTVDGYKYPTVCARCGAANADKVGQVAIPALGHDYEETGRVNPWKDESNVWHNGHVEYTCSRCGDTYEEPLLPEVEYTYTFKNGNTVIGTITKNPGEQITVDELPVATKADTPSTKYTFKAWLYDGTTDEAVFPMIISQATGDKTFVASFKEETIYYTITFYEEDGTTEFVTSGFKTYEQEFVQVGPEKEQDDTYVYTFKGWILKDADPATATPITTIKVLGDAEYKAVYEKTLRTYTVVWVIDGAVKQTNTAVSAGTVLSTLDHPADPVKDFDEAYHYVFAGWNPVLDSTVTGNTRVVAQFTRTAHHGVLMSDTVASCTQPAKKVYKCSDCDYTYEITSGSALGHQFDNDHPIEYVAPTPDADGYKIVKCVRCEETVTVPLTFYAIKLKITVKNTDGAAVAGAKVSVYDGDLFIDSDITSADGVAVVYVPEAKDYRIVIEGAEFSTVSGTITVNENGRITGGAVPTPRAVHACTCTCHKNGLWPTIFRFFHKVIKFMTGKYHCCADPDPRY